MPNDFDQQQLHSQQWRCRTSLSSLSFPAIATTCWGSGASGLHQVADHRVHVLAEYAVGLHDLDVAEAHC